jgi:hypothetical protein
MTPTTTPRATTAADLVEAGFTAEEIALLEELRQSYPAREFLETAELRRLAFLKWRVERGVGSEI